MTRVTALTGWSGTREGSLIAMERASERNQESAGRRGAVLRLLKSAAEPLPIAEVADRLGVHPNTVRFHLGALVRNGQVERVAPAHRVPGRPAQLFRVAPGMDPTGPRHYRLLAEVLADTLAADPDPRARAIEAGRAWGRRHGASTSGGAEPGEDPVARLVALLDDFGFAPEHSAPEHSAPEHSAPEHSAPEHGVPEHDTPEHDEAAAGGAPEIRLRNCPFLELATTRPQIACPIHLGLMRGAMDAWGSPVTVDRLDAFVAPDVCVARLTTVSRPA